MKLRIMSDLHLDFTPVNVDELNLQKDEVVVFAGDLGEQKLPVPFVKEVAARVRQVIYIMGNHEYYGGKIETTAFEIREAIDRTNVFVTDRGVFEIDDVMFICATLWTDFGGGHPGIMQLAKNYMSDYTHIRQGSAGDSWGAVGSTNITPDFIYTKHHGDRVFLLDSLKENRDKKCVVVTHHAPSFKSVGPRFRNANGNEFFFTNLEWMVDDHPQIKLWIHGHMHDNADYQIGETRVICNPRGYTSKYHGDVENPNWNSKLEVEV